MVVTTDEATMNIMQLKYVPRIWCGFRKCGESKKMLLVLVRSNHAKSNENKADDVL